MTGEIISLPDIDVSALHLVVYGKKADLSFTGPAVTTQSRTTQEPKDTLAVLQVDLRQDVYGPHVDDPMVE